MACVGIGRFAPSPHSLGLWLKKMNIIPGIGIGNIQYGITEFELISILGEPDRIDEEEYIEGSGDWHRELWFSPRNLSFTFNKDDDFRLGTITIMGSGYTLFGNDLFNAPKKLVRQTVSSNSGELLPTEDYSYIENEPHECLNSDLLGIMFWFDSDNLSEMQCSYLFESDNETVIWPASHNNQLKLTRRTIAPHNLARR